MVETKNEKLHFEEAEEAIAKLPKVELHVHLEGATRAETVWAMAKRNGVSLPAKTIEEWTEKFAFKNFEHFIEIYETTTSVMLTPEDWSEMVEQFLRSQSEQNIIYSEVFLSASHQLENLPLDEWTDAIEEGASSGEKLYGTRVKFIPDIARQLPETQHAVLECVLQAAKTGRFIGLGLGGIETGFPAKLFAETFQEARNQGLRVVAHAGETTGAETIWDAIQVLQAERIGHGIRCLEDANLVTELRETQLPLEVCPTSNYCLGVVSAEQPHPIRKMVDAGLLCTVNSDDPPMFGTTLTDEFRKLHRQGFTLGELRQSNLNAAESCFLPASEKEALRNRIKDSIQIGQ